MRQQDPWDSLVRKKIKALPSGDIEVHKYMHRPMSPPKCTDRKALPLAHPCLQKTHRRLSFLVREAFIQEVA